MILSASDVWTSKERSRMSTFRDKFHGTLRGTASLNKAFDVLAFLIDYCKIEWDGHGHLADKNVLSMYTQKERFSFAQPEIHYTIVTDESILNDKNRLLGAMFHELAHIFLKHSPGHAGLLPDDSEIGVMSRILYSHYEKSSLDIEHEANLMTAVFLFYPYDDFVLDLYKHPNDIRYLSDKYQADYPLVIQMIMAHGESDTHLFVVRADDRTFEIKNVPESHDAKVKAFLNDEQRLLTEDTALKKALETCADATCVSDSGYGISFHCNAFFIKEMGKVIVLGTDNGKYQERISLSRSESKSS